MKAILFNEVVQKIGEENASVIYNQMSHLPDFKQQIVIDLVLANPEKYVPLLLCDDI